MHAGIVRRHHHEALVDAIVGGGEHRIGGHIQSHMLHGTQAADAGNGRAVRHLRRHLLVGRPFTVEGIPILGQVFKNLRTGCSGICGTDLYARLIRTAGNGFVAGKQVFQSSYLLPFTNAG